jgi:3'-phosphoadenosine 5'-phosphosulfate sulfotransferase (PAPS reductase)/FAD synthetase
MFPSPQVRWCTSDHKRTQCHKVLTRLAAQALAEGHPAPVPILSCLGLRAEESPCRARRPPFGPDLAASNGRRALDVWLPLHGWSADEVWARVRSSGVPHHRAYDLGMPRLSCCFCIFAPRSALLLAGQHNPALLADYVAVEREISHDFRLGLPLVSVQRALERDERAGAVPDWLM